MKAVEARRERTKRMNDVENGAYVTSCNDPVAGEKWLQGEYSKLKARQRKRERIAWRVLWVGIATLIIIGIIYK